MPRYDVVGLGTAACDYLIQLDEFPRPDQKARADDMVIEGGGTVGTALVTVARLGRSAAFAGAQGDDAFGRFTLESLDRELVDTSLAVVTPGARSPFAFCVSVPPLRNVFSVRATTPPFKPTPAELNAILDTHFLHLDGSMEEAALAVAEEARRRGVGVSVDLQRVRPASSRLLALADVALVSESFASESFPGQSTADAVRSLWRAGMRVAGVTLGERGAVATEGGEPYEVPAESVAEVVDSTGAGDVFHGALLVGLLEGHTVREALGLATHVAALSLRALGGRAGIPTRDEVADRL